MSDATFINTMHKLTCAIDDRKIYNDVRSEIDITVTDIIIDAPAVFKTVRTDFWAAARDISQGEQVQLTLYPDPAHLPFVSWGDAVAQYYDISNATWTTLSVSVVSSTSESIIVNVLNNSGEDSWQSSAHHSVFTYAYYTYQDLPIVTHEETNIVTWTVQAKDQTSINKYGRRELNLIWPLGQTQQQMQSLVEGYLGIYKDPLPYLVMTLKGTTTPLIAQIFAREIGDRLTIENTRLGVNQDFFINGINTYHDSRDILTGVFDLEEIHASYLLTLFTLDTSELDGAHVLGV